MNDGTDGQQYDDRCLHIVRRIIFTLQMFYYLNGTNETEYRMKKSPYFQYCNVILQIFFVFVCVKTGFTKCTRTLHHSCTAAK